MRINRPALAHGGSCRGRKEGSHSVTGVGLIVSAIVFRPAVAGKRLALTIDPLTDGSPARLWTIVDHLDGESFEVGVEHKVRGDGVAATLKQVTANRSLAKPLEPVADRS